MAIETIEQEILGTRYSITQMDADRSLALETRLAPVLLRGIVPIVGAIRKSDERQAELIGIAVDAMIDTLPPDELADMITQLITQVVLVETGQQLTMADLSGGKSVLLRYRLVAFVLKANYADFFHAVLPPEILKKAGAALLAKTGLTTVPTSGDRTENSKPKMRKGKLSRPESDPAAPTGESGESASTPPH